MGCNQLANAKLNEGLEELCLNAFEDCELVKELELPKNIKEALVDEFDTISYLIILHKNEYIEDILNEYNIQYIKK